MKPSFVTPVLKKVAEDEGVTVLVEPQYQYAGQLTFPDGRRHYFKDACLDINPAGAAEIARDKAYAAFFMQQMGYPVIEGRLFFTEQWASMIGLRQSAEAACHYAKTLGFPVIVKPNDMSQGIAVAQAHGLRELRAAIRSIPPRSRAFLIQPVITGNDYRLVVLDNEVLCAYRRLPLCVIGDGISSILTLLERKQAEWRKNGRHTCISPQDPRITAKLKRQERSLDYVPQRDETITLLDNANLSTGGDAADVTAILDSSYRQPAISLARDMGLRFCGVDIITASDISAPCHAFHILEINASPGLDHYATLGAQQRQAVEQIYRKLIRALKSSPTAP